MRTQRQHFDCSHNVKLSIEKFSILCLHSTMGSFCGFVILPAAYINQFGIVNKNRRYTCSVGNVILNEFCYDLGLAKNNTTITIMALD